MSFSRRHLIAALATFLLTACSGDAGPLAELLAQPEAARAGTVDAQAAARLISQYRVQHGLKPLSLDPTLMKIAEEHAHRMASFDKMSHVLPGEGSFSQRIAAGGFRASMAAENVAAGQDSLAEVFEAWRKSPGHNANMLLPNVSLMGIALAIQPGGRYHTYWALELGERFNGPPGMAGPGEGPNAGPFVIFGR